MSRGVPRQCFSVLRPGEEYVVPSADGHVRIERLTVLGDPSPAAPQRLVVMAHNTARTVDGRDVAFEVAIASFVPGRDFDQQCDLLFSPADRCVLTLRGDGAQSVQIQYTVYPIN